MQELYAYVHTYTQRDNRKWKIQKEITQGMSGGDLGSDGYCGHAHYKQKVLYCLFPHDCISGTNVNSLFLFVIAVDKSKHATRMWTSQAPAMGVWLPQARTQTGEKWDW